MNIPRITLNIDFKSSESSGDASWLSIGYGIHQAWIYAAMFSTTAVFAIPASTTGIYGTTTSYTLPASMLVFAFALIIMGFSYKRLFTILRNKQICVAGVLSTTIGTTILLLAGTVVPAELCGLVEFVSAVFTGIGTALMIQYWGFAFARREAVSIVIDTGIAIVFGMLFYVLVICSLPFPFAGIVTCLLPLLELPILLSQIPEVQPTSNNAPSFRPLRVRPVLFFAKFGIPMFIAGLALGFFRQTCVQSVVATTDLEYRVVVLIAAAISAFLLFMNFNSFNMSRTQSWNSLFKPLVPAIIIAVAFLPFSEIPGSIAPHCILLIGYMTYEMLMWVFISILSEHYRLSSTLVVGFGRGLLALGSLIGSVAITFAFSTFAQESVEHSVVVTIILVAIFLSYLLLPDHDTINSLILYDKGKPESTAPGLSDADCDLDGDTLAEPEAAEEDTALSDSAEVDDEASPDAAQPSAAATRPASLTSPKPDAPASADDLFIADCEAVANTFLLSRRETEVCYYLARGHNSAYIQEKLYISEGTAKTHIRHIYRKLNIHSQEELIRLVEEFSTLG